MPRQGEPALRPPAGNLGQDLGRAGDPLALILPFQPTHILVLEPVGGDLVAFGGERADLVGMDVRDHRRHGEGRLEVVALQHGEQRRQSLIGAEFGLRRRQIGSADAVRSRRDAQVDGDADAAAGTLRPADFVVGEALLVRDRVAFFPRHALRLLAAQAACGRGGNFSRHQRATSSQLGNHTPGRLFIRVISRSSIATRNARPETNGCMQMLR